MLTKYEIEEVNDNNVISQTITNISLGESISINADRMILRNDLPQSFYYNPYNNRFIN